MARHCAAGLAALHSNNIIHRDVKSMNILVSEDYSAKLTDFGCSKLVPEGRVLHTANSGTPLWMAPEVKRGNYGLSADVYSLGLVLYELFERKLPNYDQNRQTVVLPPTFQSSTVVMPCLNPIPTSRPPSHQLVSVIDKMINHLVTSVRSLLPAHELEQFKDVRSSGVPTGDSTDPELMSIYRYLLRKPPHQVDELIAQVFNIEQPKKPQPQPVHPPLGYNPQHFGGRVESYPPAYHKPQPTFNNPPSYGGGDFNNNGATKWRAQISQLRDMGFQDQQLMISLLERNQGNIQNVIDALVSAN